MVMCLMLSFATLAVAARPPPPLYPSIRWTGLLIVGRSTHLLWNQLYPAPLPITARWTAVFCHPSTSSDSAQHRDSYSGPCSESDAERRRVRYFRPRPELDFAVSQLSLVRLIYNCTQRRPP